MFGSILTYRGIDVSTSLPSGVVDQENLAGSFSAFASGPPINSKPGGHGQQVTFGPTPSEVTEFRLRLGRSSEFPVGVMRVAVYADAGNNTPTGTAIAISPYYAMDSVSTSITHYYFPLSGWTPTASTPYIFLLEFFDSFPGVARVTTRFALDTYSGGKSVVSSEYTSEELGPAPAYNVAPTFDLTFAVYSVRGSYPPNPVKMRPAAGTGVQFDFYETAGTGIGTQFTITKE